MFSSPSNHAIIHEDKLQEPINLLVIFLDYGKMKEITPKCKENKEKLYAKNQQDQYFNPELLQVLLPVQQRLTW